MNLSSTLTCWDQAIARSCTRGFFAGLLRALHPESHPHHAHRASFPLVAGFTIFCSVIAGGALPSLEVLDMYGSAIGDASVLAIAAALRQGALPKLSILGLSLGVVTPASADLLVLVCHERRIYLHFSGI